MANITLKIPDDKVNDMIRALKAYGATELENDNNIGVSSLAELTKLTYPGLTHEQIIGERLKAARKDAKLTQKVLAERIGAIQSHIAEMEKGKKSIGKTRAKKLASILNMDYRVFL